MDGHNNRSNRRTVSRSLFTRSRVINCACAECAGNTWSAGAMAEGSGFSLSPSKVKKAREAIDFLSSLPGPSGLSSSSTSSSLSTSRDDGRSKNKGKLYCLVSKPRST